MAAASRIFQLRGEITVNGVRLVEQGVRRLGDKAQVAGNKLNTLSKRGSAAMNGLRKRIESSRKSMQDLQSTIGDAQTAMIVAGQQLSSIGQGLVGALAGVVSTAGDFETAMLRVSAFSGATGEALDAMSAQARELGATTRFSATEAADAMYQLSSAGLSVADVSASLPTVLDLAASAQIGLEEASKIVTGGLKGFNLAAMDATRVSDALVVATQKTKTSLPEMGMAMRDVAGVAQAAGYGLEEVVAVLGEMANSNYVGTQAGVALAAAIGRLVKPVKSTSEALERLGIQTHDSSGRLRAMVDILDDMRSAGATAADVLLIFGEEAGRKLAGLIDDSVDSIRELETSLRESDGAAAKTAETMNSGMAGATAKLRSAIEGLQIAIAESGLLDWAAEMVDRIAGIVGALAQWATEHPRLTAAMAATVAAIGTLTVAIGTLTLAIGTLSTVMGTLSATVLPRVAIAAKAVWVALAGPIGIVAAIAAATAALAAFVTKLVMTNNAQRKVAESARTMASAIGKDLSERTHQTGRALADLAAKGEKLGLAATKAKSLPAVLNQTAEAATKAAVAIERFDAAGLRKMADRAREYAKSEARRAKAEEERFARQVARDRLELSPEQTGQGGPDATYDVLAATARTPPLMAPRRSKTMESLAKWARGVETLASDLGESMIEELFLGRNSFGVGWRDQLRVLSHSFRRWAAKTIAPIAGKLAKRLGAAILNIGGGGGRVGGLGWLRIQSDRARESTEGLFGSIAHDAEASNRRLGGLIGLFRQLGLAIKDAFKGLGGGLSAIGKGIWAGIKALWVDYLRPVGTAIWAGIKALWVDYLRPVGTAIWAGIKALWNDFLSPVGDAIGNALRSLWVEFLLPAGRAIGNGLRSLWSQFLRPVGNAIGNGIRSLWNSFLLPVGNAIGKGVRALWESFLRPVGEAIGALLRAAWVEFLKPLGVTIGLAIQKLWEAFLQPVGKAIGKGIQALWEAFLRPLGKAIGNAVRSLWEAFLRPAGKAIGALLRSLWEAFLRPVGEAIGALLRSLWVEFLKPVGKAIWQAIKALWEAFLKPVGKAIGAAIKALWEDFLKPIGGRLWDLISAVVMPLWRQFFSPAAGAILGAFPGAGPQQGSGGGVTGGGLLGAITGVGSLVSGIVGNFQARTTNDRLALITQHLATQTSSFVQWYGAIVERLDRLITDIPVILRRANVLALEQAQKLGRIMVALETDIPAGLDGVRLELAGGALLAAESSASGQRAAMIAGTGTVVAAINSVSSAVRSIDVKPVVNVNVASPSRYVSRPTTPVRTPSGGSTRRYGHNPNERISRSLGRAINSYRQ